MPRRAAARRAVAYRFAVVFRTDCCASFILQQVPFWGVPLLKVGSGAYAMWSWIVLAASFRMAAPRLGLHQAPAAVP
jgi:hypothetical protein